MLGHRVGDLVAVLALGHDVEAVSRAIADAKNSADKPTLVVAKTHIGLYPFSPAALDTVRDELADFSLSKGTLRFSSDHPVPDDVLDRLVLARRDEIEGR